MFVLNATIKINVCANIEINNVFISFRLRCHWSSRQKNKRVIFSDYRNRCGRNSAFAPYN